MSINSYSSYANRFSGYNSRPAAPFGQSLLSLYKPYFTGAPYGPGGGFQQPLSISPVLKQAAPTFYGVTAGVRGIGGATSLAGGGSTAHNAGQGQSPGKGAVGGSSTDPALSKAQAFAASASDQANAAALAAMKQDVIRFGDPDVVQRILGGRARVYTHGPLAGQDKLRPNGQGYKYADIQKAAGNNAFSTVKEIDRWNQRQSTGINEQRNKQGLFYSTTRARDLALQGEDYTRSKTKAYNDLQDAISQIQQQLIAQQMGIRQNLLSAEQQAYYNQLAQAGQGGG